MKAGISTASLFLRQLNEDAISLLSEWNVACAEVFFTTFSEYDPTFSKLLAQRKGKTEVHSVHVLNTQFEPQLYNAHPRAKEDAFFWLEKVMESANVLGAKHYTFHGIARLKRTFREDFERVGKGTQEIFEFCKKRGVTLCYENVEWAFYNRPGIFRELRARCEGLKGVLDVKQARITGYPYQEYLKEMGEDLAHVHVSDVDERGKMCLPGKGTFDFDELVVRLKDVGFDGPLLIENYQTDYQSVEEIKASYEYLSELLYKHSV